MSGTRLHQRGPFLGLVALVAGLALAGCATPPDRTLSATSGPWPEDGPLEGCGLGGPASVPFKGWYWVSTEREFLKKTPFVNRTGDSEPIRIGDEFTWKFQVDVCPIGRDRVLHVLAVVSKDLGARFRPEFGHVSIPSYGTNATFEMNGIAEGPPGSGAISAIVVDVDPHRSGKQGWGVKVDY